jgi:hypothetical protein
MIGDNVVLAYLNMLARQQIWLRRLAPQFLPGLNDKGWTFVSRWMRDTGTIGDGWETARLIFIPGFLGPRTAGHWVPIIVDRQFEAGKTIIFIGDSLGRANFEDIRKRFDETPFEGADFRYLDIPRQAAGSNDCAVFMLLVFAAWLRNDCKGITMRLEKCNSKKFGEIGRKHILQSVSEGEIDINGEAVASLTFEKD